MRTPYTTKERTITQWTGEAWNLLSTSKHDQLHHKCWMETGCLITADGSNDHELKLRVYQNTKYHHRHWLSLLEVLQLAN